MRIMRVDSEDLPDGLVEAAGADGVVTVEDAPVLVGAVEDGAVDLFVWGRLLDALFEEEACGVGFLVEPIFGGGAIFSLSVSLPLSRSWRYSATARLRSPDSSSGVVS